MQIPKKEVIYEYEAGMEDTYMKYLLKSFKKTMSDNLYDFIIIDCNNDSLRSLNDFYCNAKDAGYVVREFVSINNVAAELLLF